MRLATLFAFVSLFINGSMATLLQEEGGNENISATEGTNIVSPHPPYTSDLPEVTENLLSTSLSSDANDTGATESDDHTTASVWTTTTLNVNIPEAKNESESLTGVSVVERHRRQGVHSGHLSYSRYDPPVKPAYGGKMHLCPPVHGTCPVHHQPPDVCKYPVVMKVILLSPPVVSGQEGNEDICGKFGKLAVYGQTDSQMFRSLIRFAVKKVCGCHLIPAKQFYLLAPWSAFLKDGKHFSKISLSNEVAFLEVDRQREKSLFESLETCFPGQYKPTRSPYIQNPPPVLSHKQQPYKVSGTYLQKPAHHVLQPSYHQSPKTPQLYPARVETNPVYPSGVPGIQTNSQYPPSPADTYISSPSPVILGPGVTPPHGAAHKKPLSSAGSVPLQQHTEKLPYPKKDPNPSPERFSPQSFTNPPPISKYQPPVEKTIQPSKHPYKAEAIPQQIPNVPAYTKPPVEPIKYATPANEVQPNYQTTPIYVPPMAPTVAHEHSVQVDPYKPYYSVAKLYNPSQVLYQQKYKGLEPNNPPLHASNSPVLPIYPPQQSFDVKLKYPVVILP